MRISGEWFRQCVCLGLWASPWVLPPSIAHREQDVPWNHLPLGRAPHLSSVLSKQSIWANTSAISSLSFCGHTCKGQPGGPALLMVPALPSAFSALPLSCAFLIFKAGARYLGVLLCLSRPWSQGWESLCTHPALFPACFFFPCDREVSCMLLPPTSPHSTWLAASHRSLALLFPVQTPSAALHGHLGHGCHLLWHHIFPVTCQ